MAYSEQTGIATVDALINAVAVFAGANGWTVNRNNLVSTNRTVTLKHSTTDYVHIYNADQSFVNLIGSIDYNGATAPTAQTRRSLPAIADVNSGPFTKIYMFADSTPSAYIHVVVETALAGTCKHFSFGCIDKLEAFTGGTYLDATLWQASGNSAATFYSSNCHAMFGADQSTDRGGMRCDFTADSRTDAWFAFGANPSSNPLTAQSGVTGLGSSANTFLNFPTFLTELYDNNLFSNRSIFHRHEVYVWRTGGSYWSEIGSIPNLRLCNISKFSLGQEITIGSDVWKVFPMVKPGFSPGPAYLQSSGPYGYAYKKT